MMIVTDEPQARGEAETAGAVPSDERPLPFVLRVAVRWEHFDNWPAPTDGPLLFRQRAPLTGTLAFTRDGADVQFSDLGV